MATFPWFLCHDRPYLIWGPKINITVPELLAIFNVFILTTPPGGREVILFPLYIWGTETETWSTLGAGRDRPKICNFRYENSVVEVDVS